MARPRVANGPGAMRVVVALLLLLLCGVCCAAAGTECATLVPGLLVEGSTDARWLLHRDALLLLTAARLQLPVPHRLR